MISLVAVRLVQVVVVVVVVTIQCGYERAQAASSAFANVETSMQRRALPLSESARERESRSLAYASCARDTSALKALALLSSFQVATQERLGRKSDSGRPARPSGIARPPTAAATAPTKTRLGRRRAISQEGRLARRGTVARDARASQ